MKIESKMKSLGNGPIDLKNIPIFSSFLESSTNTNLKTSGRLSLKELNRANLQSTEMAKILQNSKRSKKRYTLEQKPCATSFKHDGKFYFDCTDHKAPDGSVSSREWCYLDSPELGGKTWDFCVQIIDFDKVREANQEIMATTSHNAKKLIEQITGSLGPAGESLIKFNKLKDSQQKIGVEISNFVSESTNISSGLENLFNKKNIWGSIETKCSVISEKIDIQIKKQIFKSMNSQEVVLESTKEVIQNEEKSNNQKIAAWLQYRKMDSSYNCEGKLLYEEESKPDGLLGQYFNNPNFLGENKEQKDRLINFEFTGGSPIQGINPTLFSVRWEGYISIPQTNYYTFSVETDDGAKVFINDNEVISHRFATASVDSKDRVDKWLSEYIASKNKPSARLDKTSSVPLKLLGGTKYKIVVLYSHSVHNDIANLGKSYFKLKWSSNDFREQIIPTQYLSTMNTFAPLKVFGFNSDLMIPRKLIENDLAFKNSDLHIMQDLPVDFRGLTTLKLIHKYMEDSIDFETNIPTYVYIARLEHYPNPLPVDFENTGERFSLLEVKTPKTQNVKSIDSRFSATMSIYRKKFDAGKISIPLNKNSVNVKGIPMVLFFGFDSTIKTPLSCGGDEKLISDPSVENYKGCSTSSYYDSNWKCENGLSGINKDKEGTMWATKREGVGSWIEVHFNSLHYLTKIEIMNRRNPQERNSLIEAEFSNGSKQLFKLLNIDDVQTFKFKPFTKSTSVKLTIRGVYGTINNGAAVNIYGLLCKEIDEGVTGQTTLNGQIDPRSMSPIFLPQERPPILLQCKDSLSNTKKFDHFKMTHGRKIKIRCQDTCIYTSFKIYGDMKYSRDSAICKAAYHSGFLRKSQSLLWLVFESPLNVYNSSVRSGVKSNHKAYSDLTISFENVPDAGDLPVATGVKIDLLDPNGSGKWLPGIISTVEDSGENKILSVKIEFSEQNSEELKLHFPNKKKIVECGTYLTDRDCQGSKFNTNESTKRASINIKFAPKNFNKPGPYMLDHGETFGKSGLPFGWSRDISDRMRLRLGAQNALETLVEFAPDKKSKFCNKAIPDINCDRVTWSIKTGHGKFNVKAFIGDPSVNSRVDLSINGKPLVEGAIIEKNNLKTFEGDFDSLNEMITISSKCVNDCEYAMAKLNSLTITPFRVVETEVTEPTLTVEDSCGNAESGGKCDTGPDVVNCLFDDPLVEMAKFCNGNSFMVQVPKDYKCKGQINKYKCVLRQFPTQQECLVYCPLKCQSGLCQ